MFDWLKVLAPILGSFGTTMLGVGASSIQSDKNRQFQEDFNNSQSLTSKIAEARDNGISPLAVLGQNASNAVVSAPQAQADYSGLDSFGRSLISLTGQLGSTKMNNDTSKSIQKMKNDNELNIAKLNIDNQDKMNLDSLNTQLSIAISNNVTAKEIQDSINKANKSLEQLKSANSEFVQNEAYKKQLEMLEKQLEQAERERKSETKNTIIRGAFSTLNNLLNIAVGIFSNGALSNKNPIGFQAY